MELTFSLSEDDYVKAGRFILHRKVGGRLMYMFLALCGVVFFLGGLVGRGGPHYWPMIVGSGGCLAAAIFIWYSPVMHVRGNLRGQPEVFAPHTWNIEPSGFKATGVAATSSFKWDVVLKLLEDKQYFFFYITQATAIILPKRAIPQELMGGFRASLREWLGGRAQLDQR